MAGTERGIGAPDELLGVVLDGRYRVEAIVGRGGMGDVYRAFDMRLHRAVAVKLLRDGEAPDSTRFSAEVRTLAQFVHPNLVRVLDAAERSGRAFLVMDFVEGPTLASRLAHGALDPATTAFVGSGVAEALAYVHAAGVVHRDVKPANILLDAHGGAHLADFGIARLVDTAGSTAAGVVLGTPAYLSPEQVLGGAVGPAADVYALGLVVVECLTGSRVFVGNAAEVIAVRAYRNIELPPELDGRWRELVASMTARDPADRLGAADVVSALADRTPARRAILVPSPAVPVDSAVTEPLTIAVGSSDTVGSSDMDTVAAGLAGSDLRTSVDAVPPIGTGERHTTARMIVAALVVVAVAAGLAAVFTIGGSPRHRTRFPRGAGAATVVAHRATTTTTVPATTTTVPATTIVPATTTTTTAPVATTTLPAAPAPAPAPASGPGSSGTPGRGPGQGKGAGNGHGPGKGAGNGHGPGNGHG